MVCLIEVQVYSLGMNIADKLAQASCPPPLMQDQRAFCMSFLVWLHFQTKCNHLTWFCGLAYKVFVCRAFPPHSCAGQVCPAFVGSAEVSQRTRCQRNMKTILKKPKGSVCVCVRVCARVCVYDIYSEKIRVSSKLIRVFLLFPFHCSFRPSTHDTHTNLLESTGHFVK